MNIVTIMNYDWSDVNNSSMCLAWVRQAKQWMTTSDTAIIISKKRLPKFMEDEMASSKTIKFKQMIRNGIPPENNLTYAPQCQTEMIWYKLYIMTQLKFPFLFIDADAMIVGDLSPLNLVFDTRMPLVAIDHETDIPGHTDKYPPFINSGVIIFNDPEATFIDWFKMVEFGKRHNFSYRFPYSHKVVPGNDQALIYKYCIQNNYDYHNPFMGIIYNTCAGRITKTYKENDKWVACTKAGKVKILHYWWNYKPWKDVDCPIFNETKEHFIKNILPLMENNK